MNGERRIKLPKILVVYDSLTGNTARAAELIAEGAKAVKEVKVEIRKVDAASLKELEEAEAVIFGCPTHGFTASKKMKDFLNRPEVRETLKGKTGAIFASCRLIPRALKWLERTLENLNFKLMGKLGVRGSPKDEKENAFKNLGKQIAEHVKTS
jgi:NAD(P)H dehydrogenase (quinone)